MGFDKRKYIYMAVVAVVAAATLYVIYSLVRYGSPTEKSQNEYLIEANRLHNDSLYEAAVEPYMKAADFNTQESLVNYNMATQFCALGNTVQNSTRDIIENQNANYRGILDFLTNDKIESLRSENQALRFAASQANQNAFITANQEAQTAELIRRLGLDRQTCPIPAYVVPNPNCCYQPISFNNGGCGCGSNGGF